MYQQKPIMNFENEMNSWSGYKDIVLKIKEKLNPSKGTPNVYIIDKDINLRGRKGEDLKGEKEYKEGYNTISAADLHNNMSDDVKVILAEYRLALKRNNKRKI